MYFRKLHLKKAVIKFNFNVLKNKYTNYVILKI